MRKLYYFLFLFVSANCIQAQNSSTFIPQINNVPSSPEAAMLGRFGDIPVGYNTGTADISIPLYTVSEGNVQIPLVLSYQSSGIRVADEATWVGLGWNLDVGSIVQKVRGIKDGGDSDFFAQWQGLYNTFKSTRFNLNPIYPPGEYNLAEQVGFYTYNICDESNPGHAYDDQPPVIDNLLQGGMQPDIYSYNFAGYSGSFYINPDTHQIVIIEKNKDIKFLNDTTLTAITPDGTKFYFGGEEVCVSLQATDKYAGSTHKLTSIAFINGKTITFGYTNAHLSSRAYSQSAMLSYYCVNPPDPNQPVSISTTNSNKLILSTITTPDTNIYFNVSDRDDINYYANDTGKKLESIDIKSKSTAKKVKSFQFTYTYFTSTPTTGTVYDKRLKLESVKEIGYDSNELADTSKPAHVFTYDTSITMPPKSSYAQDFWGYNNGSVDNTGLLPDLDFFNYPYMNGYSQEFIPNPTPFVYNYTKNNRYTDNSKVGALMLKRITYPTGGYTDFEFEPHIFSNQFIPNKADLATALKQPSVYKGPCGITYSTGFSGSLLITESTRVNFLNSFSHGSPLLPDGTLNPIPVDSIYYHSRIELVQLAGGVTTHLKTWYPSNYYGNIQNFYTGTTIASNTEDVWISYTPGATYKVNVYFPNSINSSFYSNCYAANASCQLRYYANSLISTAQTKGGGLRIKSIKNYTSSGVIANNKQINYVNENGISSGKLLNKFQPLSTMQSFCIDCEGNPQSGNTGYYTRYISAFNSISIAADDFGTGGTAAIRYGRVEEVDLNGSGTDNLGKKVFKYYNTENINKRGFPSIDDPQNGLVLNAEVYNKAGTKLQEKIYTYTNTLPVVRYDGIKIIKRSFGNYDWSQGPSPSSYAVDSFTIHYTEVDAYKYSYETYPTYSYWYQVLGVTTNEYFAGTPVTRSDSYSYRTDGKQKTVTSTLDSTTGNINAVTYYYPGELPSPPASETQMITDNITGVPVLTENYKNSALLSSQKTQYAKDASTSGIDVPKYIFAKKGNETGIPFENRVTIDYYDAFGNVQQYTLTGGTPVTFIWGYNKTMPIAKIENATTADVQTALGSASTPLSNYTEANIATIDALRSNTTLAKAMITTYTYRPLVGVSTITDPKGNKITYTYDNFGRLIEVRDRYNNLLSQNQYNYRP